LRRFSTCFTPYFFISSSPNVIGEVIEVRFCVVDETHHFASE
jgi:hypothetical protein